MKRAVDRDLPLDLRATLLSAWRTNNEVTIQFVEELPAVLWKAAIPGAPLRTVRSIAAHLHNARCQWIKTLGREHGVALCAPVNHRTVSPAKLAAALRPSGAGIASLLELGLDAGGTLPESKGYVWRNLPLDVGHVLTYFVAHDAHHRGQIILVARQLDLRLPRSVTDGQWQWTRRAKEAARR
jgi:uncharacterized damage-inducible protein DinB